MNNTAKACYRVAAVQKVFADALSALSAAAEEEDDAAGRALPEVDAEGGLDACVLAAAGRVIERALVSATAHSGSARS